MAVGLSVAALNTLLLLIRIGLGHGSGCTVGCGNPTEFQREGIDYLLPRSGPSMGYQAIVPAMRFDCHGYITNWSALFVLDTRFTMLTHHMYFQLWRPVMSERELVYERVDDDYIRFSTSSQELANVESDSVDDPYVGFLQMHPRSGETESRMYFQPGDVVGFFVPAFSSFAPLGVTFRRAAAGNASSVDIYSYKSDAQLCEMSECVQNVSEHVLPQISVNYVEVNPSATTPVPLTSTCSSRAIEPCLLPTNTSTESPTLETTGSEPTESPTLETTGSEPTSSSGLMVPLFGWIIGGAVLLLLFVAVVVIIIMAVIIAFQRGKKAERRRNRNGSSNGSSIGRVTPYASANLLGYASGSEASFKKSQNDCYPGVDELRYTPLGVGVGRLGNGFTRGGGTDTNSEVYSQQMSETPPTLAETDAYRTATDSISFMTSSTVTSPSNLPGENGIYPGVISRSNEPYGDVVGDGVPRNVIDTRSENSRNSHYRAASDITNELHATNRPESSASTRISTHRESLNQPPSIPWYMGGSGVTYREETV